MNHYHVWFNLKESHKDLEFSRNLSTYLGMLQEHGHISGFRLMRRKFGFGPPELGEFHVTIFAEDLGKLDQGFSWVATREGPIDAAHAKVYSMVQDLKTALYRDFPDPQRKA